MPQDTSHSLGADRNDGFGVAPDPAGAAQRGPWTGTAGRSGSFNLAEYWSLALKYRMLVLAIALTSLVIGIGATLLTTPTYTSSVTLQIDREADRVFNVDDTTPRESMVQGEEFFQTQYGLLQSQSLAQRVIDGLGLERSDAFLTTMDVRIPRDQEAGSAAAVSRRRELVLKTVRDNLGISPQRGSRLVTISFKSPDPVLSAQVANAFADNFIQSNLDRKFQSSRYARDFLEERIAQTKTKLEDAERQLVAYATQQQIINVTSPGPNASGEQSLASNNLVTLNTALAEARAARVATEERWRQAQNAALLSLPEVYQNPAIQRLAEERARLNAQYQQNLSIYRPEFPQMLQLKAQIDELDSQTNSISRNIQSSIRSEYVVASNRERALQAQVEGLKVDVLDLRDRSIQYNILQREVDTSRTLYDGLLQRYKEVGVTGGVTTNNVSIVDGAVPPVKPSGPKLLVNLALALIFGLGLGVLAAFVLEALDESLTTPEDVEAKLALPVLGAIPRLNADESPIEALTDKRSPFSEAYYSLRAALQFSTSEGTPKSLLITSSRPGEGKSTTSFALALNLARMGKRVLLVDGDLRNPSMHRVIGTDNESGLSNLLSGGGDIPSMMRPTTQSDNLMFIPCGPLPPNPAELLTGDVIFGFVQSALTQFDHVVIDGPPVLGFADAPLLASSVSGVIFVLESKVTRRGQARGALRRLLTGHGRLLGIVVSKFNSKAASYGNYDYSYDYNYGERSKPSKTAKR